MGIKQKEKEIVNEAIAKVVDDLHFPDPHVMDPRQDPQARDNPVSFWYGYGLFRQGKWYTELKQDEDFADAYAGWCFGFVEGKRWKPWWKSKFIWLAVSVGVMSALLRTDLSIISNNPQFIAYGGATVSVIIAVLRFATKTAVH